MFQMIKITITNGSYSHFDAYKSFYHDSKNPWTPLLKIHVSLYSSQKLQVQTRDKLRLEDCVLKKVVLAIIDIETQKTLERWVFNVGNHKKNPLDLIAVKK